MLNPRAAMTAPDTIMSGVAVTVTHARDLDRSCASRAGRYDTSPGNGRPEETFEQIAGELSGLRIAG